MEKVNKRVETLKKFGVYLAIILGVIFFFWLLSSDDSSSNNSSTYDQGTPILNDQDEPTKTLTESEAEKQLTGDFEMEVCKTTDENKPCYNTEVQLFSGQPESIIFSKSNEVELRYCGDQAPAYDCWDFDGNEWEMTVPSFYYSAYQ